MQSTQLKMRSEWSDVRVTTGDECGFGGSSHCGEGCDEDKVSRRGKEVGGNILIVDVYVL